MTTREELQAIMDRPGFGTGRAFRDRKAQENEALALLPDPAWKPSIHMPRWASRLTLLVTDVSVQRLQEISRGDAMEEGFPFANMADGPNPRDWYRDLWNSIHGPDAWDRNPWVAAISFETHRCNIDTMGEGT